MRRFVQAFDADSLPGSVPAHARCGLIDAGEHYNLGKGDRAQVLVCEGDQVEAVAMTWGLVPAWSKEPVTRYTTVTARLERAARSRVFGKPWKQRHCVLPISGYYKWDRTTKPPVPHYVHARDGRALLLAGLWERWEREAPGLLSFAVLTHANDAIPAPLTPDGPVFLPGDAWRTWLTGPALFPATFLKLQRTPALAAYAVSSAHRDRTRDDYTLLELRSASDYLLDEQAGRTPEDDEDEW